jgi:hypothetical protein
MLAKVRKPPPQFRTEVASSTGDLDGFTPRLPTQPAVQFFGRGMHGSTASGGGVLGAAVPLRAQEPLKFRWRKSQSVTVKQVPFTGCEVNADFLDPFWRYRGQSQLPQPFDHCVEVAVSLNADWL